MRESDNGLVKEVCPECGSTYFYYRKTYNDYRCQTCGTIFDEPYSFCIYDYDLELVEALKKKEEPEIVLQKPKIDYSRCVICGKKAKAIHHINLDRNDNRFDNLVPLCNKCHGSFHGSINTIIGDLASAREAMTILIDQKIDVRTIYSALQTLRMKLFPYNSKNNNCNEVEDTKAEETIKLHVINFK